MGRQPDPKRKAELLEAVVDYMLGHGLSDLTLRPLAEALGTNARMLIYHFGSRDRLITEVLQAARLRQQQMLAQWAAEAPDQPLVERFRRFWAFLSAAEREPYLRFFFDLQVYAVERRSEYGELLQGLVDDWIHFIGHELIRAGWAGEDARATATLVLAVTRGLLLDLLSTRDRARIDLAVSLYLRQLSTTPRRR